MQLKKGRSEEANFVKKQVSQDVLPKELEAKVYLPPGLSPSMTIRLVGSARPMLSPEEQRICMIGSMRMRRTMMLADPKWELLAMCALLLPLWRSLASLPFPCHLFVDC
jgi:hypothetical protein